MRPKSLGTQPPIVGSTVDCGSKQPLGQGPARGIEGEGNRAHLFATSLSKPDWSKEPNR
jgi:hypothetical protein